MNSRIKISARAALTGYQRKIVPLVTAILFLFFLFSFCNAVINELNTGLSRDFLTVFAIASLLLSVIAIAPLRLFLQIRFLLLARGRANASKPDIGFSGALKACELSLRLFFVKLFWFLFFEFVPITAVSVFFVLGAGNEVSLKAAYAVLAGLFILTVTGLVFYSVFVQRYSKSMFFLACYKDFTAADAIRESIRKTKGRCAEILAFKLSFVPWFLLCIGILPALYVIPYYKQSVTCRFLSR